MGENIRQKAQSETGLRLIEIIDGTTSADDMSLYVVKPAQPVDTILESRVLTVGLHGPWSINPPLDLIITLRIRLIRMRDRYVLLDETLSYNGPAFEITEWVAQGAERLKNELDKGFEDLAERVVDDVFLLHVPGSA